MQRQRLFTAEQKQRLLANGRASVADSEGSIDHKPVVKLFGGAACTWLLTELDPEDLTRAFGLCDLGMGSPELGYVDLTELAVVRFPPFGLPVERDLYWKADKTISAYATAAYAAQRIVA